MPGRTDKVHGRAGNEKWRWVLPRVLALAAAILPLGCAGEEGRVLRIRERIAVPAEAATVALDSVGRMWLGQPGAVWVRDTTAVARAVRIPGAAPARAIGWSASAAYLRAGDSLYVLPPGADTPAARRGHFDGNPVHTDVRGRAVFQGARSGAVLAHDAETLEPLWAWAALGARTTAMTLSPQGDRLYQALGGRRDPHLLIRDLQTGRVLGRMELEEPLVGLLAGPSGDLYGVALGGRRAVVVAISPRGEQPVVLWRRGIAYDGNGARLSLGAFGERVFVGGLGEEVGLRVLEASAGAVVGRTRGNPLDAAFGPDGSLWALFPGELRRLE